MPKGYRVTDLRAYVQSRIEVVDGHWLWIGSKHPQGYGVCRVKVGDQFIFLAHRLSWTAFVGPIPEGLTIDHECLVTACIRPEPPHLRLMTLGENSADATRRRGDTETCRHGHPREGNTNVTAQGKRSCRLCKNECEVRRRRRLREREP